MTRLDILQPQYYDEMGNKQKENCEKKKPHWTCGRRGRGTVSVEVDVVFRGSGWFYREKNAEAVGVSRGQYY